MARAAVDLSVVRGVGTWEVVPGRAGTYRPVIASAKLREGIGTWDGGCSRACWNVSAGYRQRQAEGGYDQDLAKREGAPGSRLVFHAHLPHWRGARRRQRRTRSIAHGKNRIPYRIDRRLTCLAGPDYDATISFGLSFEPEGSQYGKSRLRTVTRGVSCSRGCFSVPTAALVRTATSLVVNLRGPRLPSVTRPHPRHGSVVGVDGMTEAAWPPPVDWSRETFLV